MAQVTQYGGAKLMLVALMKSNVARGLAIVALSAVSGFASPIFVSNFSFETLGGALTPCAGAGCGFTTAPIPGWVSSGSGASGQFQPGTPANTNYFTALSTGPTDAYSNGGTLSQTVLPTVQLGEVYTLMVDIGSRLDTPFTGSAALLIGSTPFLATGTQPTRGTFGTYTATYTGTSGDVGKLITIQLLASGPQGNFDNVRLDGTLAPEPTSYLLLGSALLALAGLGRRRVRG